MKCPSMTEMEAHLCADEACESVDSKGAFCMRKSHLSSWPCPCRCLTQMGTQKESFIELTERIGRKTGGLSVSPFVSDRRGTTEPLALIMISGKAMSDKAGDLLELFHDVLLTARLDDQDRFKQVPI